MGKTAIRRSKPGVSRAKACNGKAHYSNKTDAQQAGRDFADKHPGYLDRVAYVCPYSRTGNPHYHIGRRLNVPKRTTR
ncbi:hypothetical protein P3T27_007544 [Kitasatospora sp. MAA19]|uniref:hypothetical protein n=1 Tax=unclassified Kitasatospora TaxID=2633591 RepID=UPI0024750827|nr:hypothetical protein [Kitasatospora sp. MAA19]MDH6710793.1 hypothetical protein [Kitasatospora sp. MAA19]